ncbi:MAG: hypothetical protein VX498_12520 [Myxococcota bacterium]|nr:hypothetical protein [Myxococcota bacterium]
MVKRWKDMEDRIDELRGTRTHGDKQGAPREKRSWREIDAQRDGTSHADHPEARQGKKRDRDRYAEAQIQKAQKSQLEELFRDKKGDQLRADIIGAEDRAALQTAIERWLEERGDLPADSELLEKCLDARRDATLRKVVHSIAEAMPELDETARKMLLLKMQTKARRSFDAKLGKQIGALLKEHGADDS